MNIEGYNGLGGITSEFLAAFIGIFAFIFLIGLILIIFRVIGFWKILKKTGQPGWPALIPFYGDYLLCKSCGVNVWWVLIAGIASCLTGFASSDTATSIQTAISVIAYVILIYYEVILFFSLARSFGKSDAYAIGLLLLQPFFIFALGVGSSKYEGAKPINDPIMGLFNKDKK